MTLVCFALVLASFFLLARIREGHEKPVAFVLGQIATPSIFRTFFNIGVLGRPEASDRVARALRTTEAASGAIALSEIIVRLDDPDVEVREEAAKALGRIGSADAVDALLRHLTDPFSIIRSQAARALGRIGDRRAVEPLVAGLADPSEELQEACCQALGRMGAREALAPLLGLLANERSDRVAAAAGDAMSRLGAFEAALDLLPRMHATVNRGLRRQFAIALGNLLGKPGAFYPYLTGDHASRAATLSRLLAESQRNVAAILNAAPQSFESSNTREAVSDAMVDLYHAVDSLDYARIAHRVHDVALGVCRRLAGNDLPEDEALGFAFLHSARLGLGLWFAGEVKTRHFGEAGGHGDRRRSAATRICWRSRRPSACTSSPRTRKRPRRSSPRRRSSAPALGVSPRHQPAASAPGASANRYVTQSATTTSKRRLPWRSGARKSRGQPSKQAPPFSTCFAKHPRLVNSGARNPGATRDHRYRRGGRPAGGIDGPSRRGHGVLFDPSVREQQPGHARRRGRTRSTGSPRRGRRPRRTRRCPGRRARRRWRGAKRCSGRSRTGFSAKPRAAPAGPRSTARCRA